MKKTDEEFAAVPRAMLYHKVPIDPDGGNDERWTDCDVVVAADGRRYAYVPLNDDGLYRIATAGAPRSDGCSSN